MQKREGISLIVLVITIIVMIVLAGAIILSLNNAGIIGKANEAVRDTDEATVKELAQMAWAEAYASGVRKVEDTVVNGEKVEGFNTRVNAALDKNVGDKEKYIITITEKGVTVKLRTKAWIKEGFTVIKGKQVLEIGDIINYDAGVDTYTGGWKVLGATDDGNLLIMSTLNVDWRGLGFKSTDKTNEEKIVSAQSAWINGATELDNICKIYGKGKGALAARSIKVEDVDAITGYDKTKYLKGSTGEYGDTITYSYGTNLKTPSYKGGNNKSGVLREHSNDKFHYYDGNSFVTVDLTKGTPGEAFAQSTNTYYGYDATTLDTISPTQNEKAFTMIFGDYDESRNKYPNSYFLASFSKLTYSNRVSFNVNVVADGWVNGEGLFYSHENPRNVSTGVRAVVELSSDLNFIGSSESGWSY